MDRVEAWAGTARDGDGDGVDWEMRAEMREMRA